MSQNAQTIFTDDVSLQTFMDHLMKYVSNTFTGSNTTEARHTDGCSPPPLGSPSPVQIEIWRKGFIDNGRGGKDRLAI